MVKLKVKSMRLKSGRPVAFISKKFAGPLNIHEGDRIELSYLKKKIILIVNLVDKFIKKEEIALSTEARNYLNVSSGARVDFSYAVEPKSTEFILKKLNGHTLTKHEIFSIVQDIVSNSLNEAEVAYFVSGVHKNGMTFKETVYLTDAMAKTGKILKWHTNKIADKHSIGGIPGNRTTPIVVAICAAAGVVMPKTSSRAITSASGTADTMETVTNVQLSSSKLKSVVKKTNACLAWGGSLGLAPADDKLIRVEKLLGLDPRSQLLASILSKKLSVGSKTVLIDIPYGDTAKVSLPEAKKLKQMFLRMGTEFKMKMSVVLTPGFQPIGNGIGPILEILDVLKVLKREDSPKDLEKKSIFLSGKLLELTGHARKGNGEKTAQRILDSGLAFDKFEEIITAQGKKKTELKLAKFQHKITAKNNTKIKSIHNKQLNHLAWILGCPSTKSAGIYLHKHLNEEIKKGEPVVTLYSESKQKLKAGIEFFKERQPIKFR